MTYAEYSKLSDHLARTVKAFRELQHATSGDYPNDKAIYIHGERPVTYRIMLPDVDASSMIHFQFDKYVCDIYDTCASLGITDVPEDVKEYTNNGE